MKANTYAALAVIAIENATIATESARVYEPIRRSRTRAFAATAILNEEEKQRTPANASRYDSRSQTRAVAATRMDENIERPCAGLVNKRLRPIKGERRESQSVKNMTARKGGRPRWWRWKSENARA